MTIYYLNCRFVCTSYVQRWDLTLKRQITVHKSGMRNSFYFHENVSEILAGSRQEKVSLIRFETSLDSVQPDDLH